eukprot:TRINITY_DN6392_c0_g2_i3.p1 TRINITY_DN6392_c0_g2~~TRINITY_DN6392_c0_g2_i3.p1  ORF type:complete len:169 (+),score=19.94 TRINITY_DN6392_c0_g2_i3:145-651(+)
MRNTVRAGLGTILFLAMGFFLLAYSHLSGTARSFEELSNTLMALGGTTSLSQELLLHVFSFLDWKSLLSAGQVCHRWNHVIESSQMLEVHFGSFRSYIASDSSKKCALELLDEKHSIRKNMQLARERLERVKGLHTCIISSGKMRHAQLPRELKVFCGIHSAAIVSVC